ncbi:formyltransferase family protein [Halomonas sp. CSM-2]|uniref:formyltransferase family protein n=1 Tax=Halomonas sp. CSM-2 TaxID=1975722 RepID=UPI000A285416|nr:formyltransferase family protein [Halomonas sp. CSM-2]
MKVALYTSNQPRHIYLAEKLIAAGHDLHVIQEVTTVFPGQRKGVFQRSETMAKYFSKVQKAERKFFGYPRALVGGSSVLSLPMGEISNISLNSLDNALDADVSIVFGSSYIKGELAQYLIDRNAINIHMGISPFFRGSSCNFWALYDGFPELVGATIHKLSRGLDSGAILFYSFPKSAHNNGFEFTMSAVEAVIDDLLHAIDAEIWKQSGEEQDSKKQIRYSRSTDFTDEIAQRFMERPFYPQEIEKVLINRSISE